jgi:CSLREA domain-containing protein
MLPLRPTLLAVALSSALAVDIAAQAATITVTTTDDGSPTGQCSLRDAILAANDNSPQAACVAGDAGNDEIVFAGGVAGTIHLDDGQLEVTEDLTIIGPGSAELVIDAGGASRILRFDTVSSRISGVTLTGGYVDYESGGAILATGNLEVAGLAVIDNSVTGPYCTGGGIAVDGSLAVTDSTVSGNSTYGYEQANGGGIWVKGSITLTNSIVSGNSTRGDYTAKGGGLYVDGDSADVTIEQSHISGNWTDSGTLGNGGGIWAQITENGTLTIDDSTIDGNWTEGDASFGGGAYLTGGCSPTDVSCSDTIAIRNSLVSNNRTAGDFSGSGGLELRHARQISVVDSTISGNWTEGDNADYGGVYATFRSDEGSGPFEFSVVRSTISGNSTHGDGSANAGLGVNNGVFALYRSTVSGNSTEGTSADGAGLYLGSVTASIVNSTISGNTTTGNDSPGAGIHISAYSVTTFLHSTIVDNSSASGVDGILLDDPDIVSVMNSVIAQNGGGEVACSAAIDGVGSIGNLVTDTTCGTDSLIGGAAASLAGLALGPLADNGGRTRTHALLEGSIAIDTADDDACASEGVNSIDQRGDGRPVDGDGDESARCDVGAYEWNGDHIFAGGFDGA